MRTFSNMDKPKRLRSHKKGSWNSNYVQVTIDDSKDSWTEPQTPSQISRSGLEVDHIIATYHYPTTIKLFWEKLHWNFFMMGITNVVESYERLVRIFSDTHWSHGHHGSPGTQVGYLSFQWLKWTGKKILRKNLVSTTFFVFWTISSDTLVPWSP